MYIPSSGSFAGSSNISPYSEKNARVSLKRTLFQTFLTVSHDLYKIKIKKKQFRYFSINQDIENISDANHVLESKMHDISHCTGMHTVC
jgi:hypothetical protein